MVDVVGIIASIGKLVKNIMDAVDTANRNVKQCQRIKELVVEVDIMLTNNFTEKQTNTLKLLEKTLLETSKLIDKCQDQGKVKRTKEASNMREELQQAELQISSRMLALNMAITLELRQDNKVLKRNTRETRDTINQVADAFARMERDAFARMERMERDAFARMERQQVEVLQKVESLQTLCIRDDSIIDTRSDNKTTGKNTKSDAASREKEDGNKASFTQHERLATLVTKAGLQKYTLSELGRLADLQKCEIGSGGTGTVYKKKIVQKVVAVKVFHKLGSENELLTRLHHEIELLTRLNKHQNIIELRGCCYPDEGKDGDFYLVSRCMQKESFARFIDGTHGKKIDLASLIPIIQGIAEGVRYLHEQRVVHLDLKPGHIVFDSKKTPKIIDFQTARALDNDVDEIQFEMNKLPGSLGYMAPELQKKGKASIESDVFSFGIILFKALSCICKTQDVVVSADDTTRDLPVIVTEWINRLYDWTNVFDETRVTRDYELMVARSYVFAAFRCCERDPASRPSMSDVVELLSVGSLVTEGTTRSLTEDQLRKQLEEDKRSIVKRLGYENHTGVGEALLRYFRWTPDTVLKEWQSNSNAVCKDVGLHWHDGTPVTMRLGDKRKPCQYEKCKNDDPASEKRSAGCGHYYCESCWPKIISEKVDRMVSHHYTHGGAPKPWLFLECWLPSCKAPIVQNLVDNVANDKVKTTYAQYLLRSYVEDSGGRRKFCPNERYCSCAIQLVEGISIDDGVAMDVVCHSCNYAFCWSCLKEPHEAVSSKCSGMQAVTAARSPIKAQSKLRA